MNKPVPTTTYSQLVKTIAATIQSGRVAIQKAQAETYWNVGKYISDYVLNGADRAEYGEHIFEHLSEDLKLDIKTLRQTVRFSREFSIQDARPELTWTQFRTLLALPDPETRKRLFNETVTKKLTTRQLQDEVKRRKTLLRIPSEGPIPRLKVLRGSLYTYKIIEMKFLNKDDKDNKFVDMGFDISRKFPPLQLAKFKDGDLIETVKTDEDYKIKSSDRSAKDLYTFKALIERIVDGDTALVSVDCGFGLWKRQYLRFRGINCPELSTAPGQAVKRFIEARIKPNDFVIIKTHKDDKYGRYLVDVWYAPTSVIARSEATRQSLKDQPQWPEPKVAAEGIYLNQELLDNRLAVVMKS